MLCFIFACEAAGASSARHSLRPLKGAGREEHNPGGSRRGNAESYRNEREKANLLYWQLTCKSFYSVEDWAWLYGQIGYTGDYGFIFFE